MEIAFQSASKMKINLSIVSVSQLPPPLPASIPGSPDSRAWRHKEKKKVGKRYFPRNNGQGSRGAEKILQLAHCFLVIVYKSKIKIDKNSGKNYPIKAGTKY